MTELLLHRGAQEVTKEELALVPVPEATETYQPVAHHELARTLTTIGQDILTDYTMIGETYALARNGNQMFAVLKFQGEHSDTALSFAFRNSLDKSMSIGFACGLSVFICDNLALNGDIVVMKKHTKNLFNSLEDSAITTLYKAQHQYAALIGDSDLMKKTRFSDDDAYKLLGLLFGNGVLSPRQIPVVRDEWLKPSHQDFEPRNLWSFYNCCTEALKGSAPQLVMEKYVNLHKYATEAIADNYTRNGGFW